MVVKGNCRRYIVILSKDDKEKTYIVDANYPQEAIKKVATILVDLETSKKIADDSFYAVKMNQKFKEMTGHEIIHFSSIADQFYNDKPVFWGAKQCQN